LLLNSPYSTDEPKSIRSIVAHTPIPMSNNDSFPHPVIYPSHIISALYFWFHGACTSPFISVLTPKSTATRADGFSDTANLSVPRWHRQIPHAFYSLVIFEFQTSGQTRQRRCGSQCFRARAVRFRYFFVLNTGCGCDGGCFLLKFWWYL
jgi:hypothetical protein